MDTEDDFVVCVDADDVVVVAAVAAAAPVVAAVVSVTTVTAMVGLVPGVVFPLLNININMINRFPYTSPSVDQSNRSILCLFADREVSQTKILHSSDLLKFLLSAALLRLDLGDHLGCPGVTGAGGCQVLRCNKGYQLTIILYCNGLTGLSWTVTRL